MVLPKHIDPLKKYFFLVVFYVTPTQYKSYGDFPALLVEGKPQVPFYALFQAQTTIRVEPLTYCILAG
jgi:hypothetical protein